MSLKIGVLGLGHLGKIHVKCLLQLPDVFEIVGAYDPNPEQGEKVAQAYQIPIFSNPDKLIQKCDAIDIVSATSSHYELASKALKMGKHVFIEKPVASNTEQGEALLALEKEFDRIVQVGHVERFNPAYLAIADIRINPLFIESHRLANFNIRGTDVSVVLDLMIHDLDLILHLVDSEVVQINASGVCVVSNTPDISNARIEFANGCVANVTASRLSLKDMRKMRVFQSDAYISMDFLERQTQVIKIEETQPGIEFPDKFILETPSGTKAISVSTPIVPEVNAIQEELKAFANSILKGATVMVSLTAAVKALQLAYKIEEQINSKLNKLNTEI